MLVEMTGWVSSSRIPTAVVGKCDSLVVKRYNISMTESYYKLVLPSRYIVKLEDSHLLMP